MLFGIGWCVLRSSQDAYATATWDDIFTISKQVNAADEQLWLNFRAWMADNASPWLLWMLHEHHNNHKGVLQCFVSRNHRGSPFWSMLEWIAEHGPGSYGLFYVHDDEDEGKWPMRKTGIDQSNVFRVHRILNGRVEELPDPFFDDIVPNIEPAWPEA
jgi:hypothetical protein